MHDDEAKERTHPLFHPRFRRFAFAFSLPLSRSGSRCLALTCFLSCLRARSLALDLSISRSLVLYFKWLSTLSFSHCLIHLQDPTHRHLRPSFLPPLHLLACSHRSHPHFWNCLESAVYYQVQGPDLQPTAGYNPE